MQNKQTSLTQFGSNSTKNNKTDDYNNDLLLIESENVLSTLNNIIDSHDVTNKSIRIKKNIDIKKQASLLKASSHIQMTNKEQNQQYHNHYQHHHHLNSFINNKTTSNSISGLNSIKKFKSKSFLLSLNRRILDSPSNSSISTFDQVSYNNNNNNNNNSYNTKVSNLSGSKSISKKSSSNFLNIMSSSVTNNQQTQPQQQQQTFNSTCLLNSSKKKRSSLFNLFSFNKNSSTTSLTKSTLTNNNNNNNNNENEKTDNSSLEQIDSTNRYRPHSIAFPSNFQTIHRMSTGTTATTSTSTVMSESFKPSKDFRSISKNTKLLIPTSSDSATNTVTLIKKTSIQSKGFSIPLNASFCLNPIPINCLNHYSISSNLELNKSKTCLCSQQKELITNSNDLNNKMIEPIIDNIDNVELVNNEEFDDSVFFKPASFDLDTEGSCLKELNQRFRLNNDNNNNNSKMNELDLSKKIMKSDYYVNKKVMIFVS
jgi:hypothetical protein